MRRKNRSILANEITSDSPQMDVTYERYGKGMKNSESYIDSRNRETTKKWEFSDGQSKQPDFIYSCYQHKHRVSLDLKRFRLVNAIQARQAYFFQVA